MTSIWQDYPDSYRHKEVSAILKAVESGACVSVVGLSGSGKSNLLGFVANRASDGIKWIFVDANRASVKDSAGFFKAVLQACGETMPADDPLERLHQLTGELLNAVPGRVCLVIDRFDAFPEEHQRVIAGQLRYLRDAYKYALTFVTGTRAPIPDDTELAELFYGHTIFLGPLSRQDAGWSVRVFASRSRVNWDEKTVNGIIDASLGYPSFLRGACEAVLDGCAVTSEALKEHPAVRRRLDEFLSANPSMELLENCGLASHPWLTAPARDAEGSHLTQQEFKLLACLRDHQGEVCTKDDLIKAVWPEDRIYDQGLRDDSLAQLIRRLREKIEPNPSAPQKIKTVSGRGYVFKE